MVAFRQIKNSRKRKTGRRETIRRKRTISKRIARDSRRARAARTRIRRTGRGRGNPAPRISSRGARAATRTDSRGSSLNRTGTILRVGKAARERTGRT
ncbi:MAG TPA: hypothetical protein PLF54_04785 [Deltaproteobacteria bacterium]|nr:hypothetical protein [Deltaproteobacteria bacterium]